MARCFKSPFLLSRGNSVELQQHWLGFVGAFPPYRRVAKCVFLRMTSIKTS